jgi:hypothetical protein
MKKRAVEFFFMLNILRFKNLSINDIYIQITLKFIFLNCILINKIFL